MIKENTFYDKHPYIFFNSEKEAIKNMDSNLKDLIKKHKDKVIYDIGCGCGRNLYFASKYGKKIYAIDISKISLNLAEKTIKSKNVIFKEGDNLNLDIKNNSADLVISEGVIHHTGNTKKAFKECVRILKSGGYFYLEVYKKWRYYAFIYMYLGGVMRVLTKFKLTNHIIEKICIPLHYKLSKFKKIHKNSTKQDIKNIFYDYFITPIAGFQSKKTVQRWIDEAGCSLIKYKKTNQNCHRFIIKKL